jgi:quercetin dioxygenase-like cupin family protein
MNNTMRLLVCGLALSLAALATHAQDPMETGIMLTPDDLQWVPNPRVPELESAPLLGDSQKPGPYVQRVRFPPNQILRGHTHPDDRTYTVISGTWYVGWGKSFDEAKLTALPPGSFYTEPASVPHFVATKDEFVVVQISGVGPTAVDYTEPAHPPGR